MLKTIISFMLLMWSQFCLAVLAPTKITSYQVDYDPYKVLSYGACKIDGEYHVLMTVGLAIKSRDGVNWQKYEAFKAGNVRMQGGPDLISCGKNPAFFSRDFGLYYYKGQGWVKKGAAIKNARSYYENSDRSIFVYLKDAEEIFVSSEQGWIDPKEFSNYKDDSYDIAYYDGSSFVVGIYNESVKKLIKRIGANNISREYSNKLVEHLNEIPFRVVNLNGYIYIYNVDLQGGALRINQDGGFNMSSINVLNNAEIDLLKCVGVKDDLSACHLYPSGVVFISLIEEKLVFYKINAPKSVIDKKPNVVFGKNEVLFEVSDSDETKDKELVLSGTIIEYSYDSILKYMRERN